MPTVRLLNHQFTYPVQDVLHLFFGQVTILSPTELRAGSPDPVILSRRFASGEISTWLEGEDRLFLSQSSGESAAGEAGEDGETPDGSDVPAKREVKRQLYFLLSRLTGIQYPWGSLTGIRPTYIARQLLRIHGSREEALRKLTDFYGVMPEKADLCLETASEEDRLMSRFPEQNLGVYIGIPFCPTRCSYCSFSTQEGIGRPAGDMDRYLDALLLELETVWTDPVFLAQLQAAGSRVQALYIGGGTPTSLKAAQLVRLFEGLRRLGLLQAGTELTLEAGRPDTITEEKLLAAKNFGFGRISINPQTLKDDTLKRIGRRHSSEDIRACFSLARALGFKQINMDLIAGLEDETLSDFRSSLDETLQMNPHSVTVHSLAVKRTSRLHRTMAESSQQDQTDPNRNLRAQLLMPDEAMNGMLLYARSELGKHGLYPYYLYRQKDGRGSLENCAFAPKGEGNLYNIAMMGDSRSILGFGAGSMSKRVEGGLAKRSPNVRNIEEYSQRAAEMARRKLDLWK